MVSPNITGLPNAYESSGDLLLHPSAQGLDTQRLPLSEGEEAVPVEDEKTVRPRLERAKAEQLSRPAYKPAPDHPWRRSLKPAASGIAAG